MNTQIDICPRHSILEIFDVGCIREDVDRSLVTISSGDVVVEIAREAVGIIGCPIGGEAREDEVEGEGTEIGGLVDKGTIGDTPTSCTMRQRCSSANNVRALIRFV